jgi:hypothetical protein
VDGPLKLRLLPFVETNDDGSFLAQLTSGTSWGLVVDDEYLNSLSVEGLIWSIAIAGPRGGLEPEIRSSSAPTSAGPVGSKGQGGEGSA